METLDAIATRRSIRKFKDAPVEFYLIGKVLHAGFNAPTAGNLQDFRFMIVSNPALKQGIAHACMEQLWIAQAPVLIVVFSEFTKTKRFYGIRGERLYTIQGCAAAVQNILLAAHDLGLGTCWVGAFDEDKVCQVLGIPDYARPQAIIPLGWPDEEVPEPAKFKLENLIFFNRWGDNAGKTLGIETEILKDKAPYVMKAIDKVKGAFTGIGSETGNKITEKGKDFFSRLTGKKGKK